MGRLGTRLKRLATVLFVALLVCAVLPGSSRKPSISKKQAKQMVQRAFASMDLASSGAAPFHLVANVYYELSGWSGDGTYELLWASPNRWREIFHMKGLESEDDLALGDKFYFQRSGAAPTLPFLCVRAMLHATKPGAFAWNLSVRSISEEEVNGQRQICVDARNSAISERACLDASSGQLISLHDTGRATVDYLALDRTAFACVGNNCFPRKIGSRYFDERVQVRVTLLERAPQFAPDVFIAPEGSVARTWCPAPTRKGQDWGPFNVTIAPPRLIAYWLLVGPNGRLENAVVLRSGGSDIDHQLERTFHSGRFPIESCGTTPIEYGELFYLPSHLQ